MNEVRLCGVVKRTWTYAGVLYARLAVRRRRGRPRRSPQAGGNYDYVTVVFPGDGTHLPELRPEQRLSVHGWVQSRDLDESLATYLARARPANFVSLAPALAKRIVVGRSVTEVVAERWEVEESM